MAAGNKTDAHQDGLHGTLPHGARLRNYELISVLGQGGFGITYFARDTTLGREVAIKEYLPTSLALREDGSMVVPRSTQLAEDFVWGRERFLEEARVLATLEGVPAVVRVYDFLEANGTAYMVMGLARGDTLEQRLKRGKQLSPPVVEQIFQRLLDGLEAVHKAGFLHRDIKPANIILDTNDNPTFIDFGASRASVADRDAGLTAIFTPRYAAAEQLTSDRQGPYTDIYSISATLHHVIIGRPPPCSLERALNDTYKPLAELAPEGFSPALLEMIDAGLAVRANDRPQSIAAWRGSILAATPAVDDATIVGTRRKPRLEAKRSSRSVPPPTARSAFTARLFAAGKGRTAIIGGAVFAVFVLAAAGYWAFSARTTAVLVLHQDLKTGDRDEAAKQKAEAEARQKPETEAQAQKAATEAQQRAAAEGRQKDEAEAQQKAAEAQQRAEADARQKAAVETQQRAQAEARQKAEADANKQFEEETRRKIESEMATQKKAEEAKHKEEEEEAEKHRQAVEAARKAVEFASGSFDHFGKTLMLIGLKGQPDEVRLQGVDIVNDPALHKLAVDALAVQPRDLRCRQTDRLTDGTPLYRCLITPLNAKPPLPDVPDSDRTDLALTLVHVGVVLASCDAPRSYADAEDDARGRKQALWGRVTVQEYKRRCTK